MPVKRKALDEVANDRASKRSTPVPTGPRDANEDEVLDDGDDDYGESIEGSDADEMERERSEKRSSSFRKFERNSNFSSISRQNRNRQSTYHAIFKNKDFHASPLKPDHEKRPLWIDARVSEGSTRGPKITLESFSPLASQATDLLTTIAEPMSRPAFLHEYRFTSNSLYAALSVGLKGEDIIRALEKLSKTPVPQEVIDFINQNTKTYGKIRMVLRNNRFWIESEDEAIIKMLLDDPIIGPCKAVGAEVETGILQTKGTVIQGTTEAKGLRQAGQANQEVPRDNSTVDPQSMVADLQNEDDDDEDEDNFRRTHSFEIARNKRDIVAEQCLEIGYPAVSEYDFQNDRVNATLEIDLKPQTSIRPYQEKALSKMFGNGRGKSGIIVLPCGAGKTLVGITAGCHIKKSIVVLCTSSMSMNQWANEFRKWSDIREDAIGVFSANDKKKFSGDAGILVSTYSIMSMFVSDDEQEKSGKKPRSVAHDTKQMLDWIQSREWGLMILDEVHVVPAKMFRKVGEVVRSHCKLGLTATLLREDDKITDLNFLIGPKLYEANWMELSEQGHIAKVQCAEVWCPMTKEFYTEYQKERTKKQALFYIMNPTKFQVCQFLINYHEARGDKIIVFSDNIYALEHYAKTLVRPFIFGGTGNKERIDILENFQYDANINTIFLSKIGDTSLDLPEATCLIQISSHYGSRRQEAQRLGRILRAKRRNDEGFNAFFYTLVSKDTSEMVYSAKRQAFLVDQGYAFKTITHLNGIDDMPNLKYRSDRERRELLADVCLASESSAEVEQIKDSAWSHLSGGGKKAAAKKVVRQAVSMADAAGGGIMAPLYKELDSGTGRRKKKDPTADGAFFAKEARRRENALKKKRAEEAEGARQQR